MPKRTDLKKILIIGSGPIVIGQAAEFDYAGTQACLALKEEGYEVVLVNSNPATIMTDTTIADKVYMEPLTLEYIAKILRYERPDAILPGIGGQTGLNLAMQLAKKGILKECQVELLGTSIDSIERAEDRELFKEMCESIGEPVIPSVITYSVEEGIEAANKIGYPVVLRPAFTLGGTGGGVANANVYVYEEETQELVFETVTDDNGDCKLELIAGIYVVQVECEGFIIEAFAIEIYSSGICSVESLVVSPELVSGEMRIVLEWGDYPSDLDSYLVDSYGDVAINYQDKYWYDGDNLLGELDVDDTSSYGPETITVYDTTQNFTYYVHDFSNTGMMFSREDVTVKVYLPGASAPQVYTIPVTGGDGRGWCVFSWVNGRIVTQDYEVGGRDNFTHVG